MHVITLSKDEEENRPGKTAADLIANEIFEYADERVGHAEGAPKGEILLACYRRLGELLGQWARSLDRLEKVNEEPAWLREFVRRKESLDGRRLVSYDSASLGFPVENLYFAREKAAEAEKALSLSHDKILVSEPSTLLMEDFKNLLTFCEENGLDFYVDGFSSRQPGRTFRLAVYAPKLMVRSQTEFREKTLLAMRLFKELSSAPAGVQPIERKALIAELIKTGQLDEHMAEKVVEVIVARGLVSRSLIVE